MAATLSATIRLALTIAQTDSIDLETVSASLSYSKNKSLTTGTGNNQGNVVFSDTRTLLASATEDLDLAGGLVNAFGKTITFTKVKALVVKAAEANTNSVLVSRPAANGLVLFSAASDEIAIPKDGLFVLTAPYAGITVTGGTGDLLTITNSAGGTSVVYDIVIIGVGTTA